MIFTLGRTSDYERYFQEQEQPCKLGRTTDYAGGSVWKTFQEAEKHKPEGFSVYGVLADWVKDTAKSLDQNATYHDLVTTSPLVKLQPAICSDYVLKLFPKPCCPRVSHECRICGEIIAPKEPCCRWEGLQPGSGRFTSHAHPECYSMTRKWDNGDWECNAPGDCSRPKIAMIWPTP